MTLGQDLFSVIPLKDLGPWAGVVIIAATFVIIWKAVRPDWNKVREDRKRERQAERDHQSELLEKECQIAALRAQEAMHLQQSAAVSAELSRTLAAQIETMRQSHVELREGVHEARDLVQEVATLHGIVKERPVSKIGDER